MTTCASGIYSPTTRSSPSSPRIRRSTFVELGDVDLDEIFFEQAVRTVGKDNTVCLDGVSFQIEKQLGRRTCAGLAVQIRRHLDGGHTVRRGTQLLGAYDCDGCPLAPQGDNADSPGCRGNDAGDSGRLQGRPRHRGSRSPPRSGRARVPASGRLRLPTAGTPVSSCGIEGLAKADRSLVKNQRTDHLSSTAGKKRQWATRRLRAQAGREAARPIGQVTPVPPRPQ